MERQTFLTRVRTRIERGYKSVAFPCRCYVERVLPPSFITVIERIAVRVREARENTPMLQLRPGVVEEQTASLRQTFKSFRFNRGNSVVSM